MCLEMIFRHVKNIIWFILYGHKVKQSSGTRVFHCTPKVPDGFPPGVPVRLQAQVRAAVVGGVAALASAGDGNRRLASWSTWGNPW